MLSAAFEALHSAVDLALTGIGHVARLIQTCTPHVLNAIHFLLVNTATLTFGVCYGLMEVASYIVYGLCVFTKLLVTTLFSVFAWTLHVLMVCVVTIFHIVWYLVPTFEFIGRLTLSFAEKLLDTETLPHPFPIDAVFGAVITAFLVYGLVRGSTHLVARARHKLHSPGARNGSKRHIPRSLLDRRPKREDPHLDEPHVQDVDGKISTLIAELDMVKQQRLCVVCYDGQKEVVLKPCQHLCACSVCAPALNDCPICRKPVQGQEKIYDA